MNDDELRSAGGPAFPVPIGSQREQYFSAPGMTLRDWFAGQALPATFVAQSGFEAMARQAYAVADAMLAEREKGRKSTAPVSAPSS